MHADTATRQHWMSVLAHSQPAELAARLNALNINADYEVIRAAETGLVQIQARMGGTGGIQLTASVIGESDVLKVIDQGADDTTNAVSIRHFFKRVTGVNTTERTDDATLIQTRHRIPETPLTEDQIVIFQVPIPKFDNPKMDMMPALQLFGAGREKRIYAVPPFTRVESLDFDDHPFTVQQWDEPCAICGSTHSYLDEVVLDDAGNRMFVCSDTDYCRQQNEAKSQ
ncbi:hypothetical protein BGK51_20825 [Shigella sp. FC569]|nr:hypothetical protein BGK51_20825 [Shigella sp. FC569]